MYCIQLLRPVQMPNMTGFQLMFWTPCILPKLEVQPGSPALWSPFSSPPPARSVPADKHCRLFLPRQSPVSLPSVPSEDFMSSPHPPSLPQTPPQSTDHPTNSSPSVSSINRQSNRSPYPKRPSGAWQPTYRVVSSLVICKPLHNQAQFCSQIAPVLTNSALEQNWDSQDHIHDSPKRHMASCLCSFPEVYL